MNELLDSLYTFQSDEHAALVNAVCALLNVQTIKQFLVWTQTELQSLLPHGALICGIGYINRPTIRMIESYNVNFPMAYMEEIKQSDGGVLSPIMAKWLKERKPQLFDAACASHDIPDEWLTIFNRHNLNNIVAHGRQCNSKPIASYFSFFRIPEPLEQRHVMLLEFLVPQMHHVITGILFNQSQVLRKPISDRLSHSVMLTQREKEVLRWMSEGKTNWEIAQILAVSKETVNTHVKKILSKFNVHNRAQAILCAKGYAAEAKEPSRIYSRHDD